MQEEIRINFSDFWYPTTVDAILNSSLFRMLSPRFNLKIVDQPDFLIYSCFGKEFLKYDCVKIFYTGENVRPNFAHCDYAFSFDYPITEKNYRLPIYKLSVLQNHTYLTEALTKTLATRDLDLAQILIEKRRFCNFVYSNSQAKQRIQFFNALQKYQPIDAGGAVMNNLGYQIGSRIEDKLAFLSQYKFTIAFENSSYPGYTTEKILHAFLAHTIPIYWGNPLIAQDFNPNAMINCHDYDSFKAAIDRVIEVDKNDDLYQEYLKQPVFLSPDGNEYINETNIFNRFAKIFSSRHQSKSRATLTQLNRDTIPDSAPLVSIIIPCYNQAHYLGEAIESVLAQSHRHFEIIVIDDGSPDQTAAVASQYPVRYIKQDNQGVSSARNTGIRASQGKYLVFLDADDRLTPNALQIGLEYLTAHPDWAFVSGHYRYINHDGSVRHEFSPMGIQGDYYQALLQGNYISMHATVLYQRRVFELVGEFNPLLKSCEDYDLFLRTARQLPIGHHAQITAEYRRHPTNTTRDYNLVLKDTLILFRSQWQYVYRSPKYLWAYRAGLRTGRNYLGWHLLQHIVTALASRQWEEVTFSLKMVPRYYALSIAVIAHEIQVIGWLCLQVLKFQPQGAPRFLIDQNESAKSDNSALK